MTLKSNVFSIDDNDIMKTKSVKQLAKFNLHRSNSFGDIDTSTFRPPKIK